MGISEDVKIKVKIESDDTSAHLSSPVGKRRRVLPISSGDTNRSSAKRRQSGRKNTPVKQEIVEEIKAVIYPTPSETPVSGRPLDLEYFPESPVSAVVRAKRMRRTTMTNANG